MNPPDNLPPLPPVPEGFDRWEYRGTEWKDGRQAVYATTNTNTTGATTPDDWHLQNARPMGARWLHYLEAVREPASPLQHPAGPKDWPEDATLENGGYQNNCSNCQGVFYGHKRRVFCRECCESAKDEPASGEACHCQDCNPSAWWMIVCDKCGNKRCPRAAHHLNECTGSNAVGQAMKHQPRPQNRMAAFDASMSPTGVEARVCGWRGIESAPRDGTHILAALLWRDEYTQTVIHWTANCWQLAETGGNATDGDPDGKPTHWQPLPQPPEGGPEKP